MTVSLIVSAISLLVFVVFQAQGIYAGDSGDLVTAAAVGGVAHPPGYPLFTGLGWALSHSPFFTVNWRVGLLSSIPHAVVAGFVYSIVYRLSKNRIAGIFASLALVGNYLFFLYSVTPEVFGLFDFFVASLVYVLLRLSESKKVCWLYAGSLLFGLSLAHHHVILFMVPAIAYLLHNYAKMNRLDIKTVLKSVGFFGMGLLPYLYVPWASYFDPIINWDRVRSFSRFIHLVTRADYGSFVSSPVYGDSLYERFLSIRAFGTFLLTDWYWVGIVLCGLGLAYLWRRKKIFFSVWLISFLCLGPLFFFYASFPLASRFTLGTYERFLLPSYVLVSIAIGLGYHVIVSKLRYALAAGIVLFLFPCLIGAMTLYRFWDIRLDKTAEHLGQDILESAPIGAIIFLSGDTSLFTTQYVRYALGQRKDTIVIHASRLNLSDYQQTLKSRFPNLVIPRVSPESFVSEFVALNSPKYPVMSNAVSPIGDRWYWVPHGLLLRATKFEDLPSSETMYRDNLALFSRFSDPREGILARYNHLMLSDVRDVYAESYITLGNTLSRAKMWDEAKDAFNKAISYSGETSQSKAFTNLGVAQSVTLECDLALISFDQAEKYSYTEMDELLMYRGVTYRDCVGDVTKGASLLEEYEKRLRDRETPL